MLEAKAFLRGTSTGTAGGFRNQWRNRQSRLALPVSDCQRPPILAFWADPQSRDVRTSMQNARRRLNEPLRMRKKNTGCVIHTTEVCPGLQTRWGLNLLPWISKNLLSGVAKLLFFHDPFPGSFIDMLKHPFSFFENGCSLTVCGRLQMLYLQPATFILCAEW